MSKRISIISVLVGISFFAFSQIPPNYYDNAIGLRQDAMKLALHNIIKGHTSVSYASLKDTYHEITDKKPNGKVWDMYSDIPGGTPPYEYSFISADKCGNYAVEGDCYNREHSFPQSWFNSNSPMQSDLFHVYPTDGKVNGWRSSYPFGEVSNPSVTTQNGSKKGPNTTSGYSGIVFEPIDAYKGDFARTYFYMATRYYTEDGSWSNNDMTNGAEPKPWALNMLYQWHLQDTVSQKEIDRNNAVYGIQNNRNPFIDHPEWVDSIWFDDTSIEKLSTLFDVNTYPNPANDKVTINFSSFTQQNYLVEIYDLSGRKLISIKDVKDNMDIDIQGLSKGLYLVHITSDNGLSSKNIKLIKQ